jgi:hypothetical protein
MIQKYDPIIQGNTQFESLFGVFNISGMQITG